MMKQLLQHAGLGMFLYACIHMPQDLSLPMWVASAARHQIIHILELLPKVT